jgi:hypothetical protein
MSRIAESSSTAFAGSRELLEAVLANLADGVLVASATGERLYANDAAARLAGFGSAAELLAAPADLVRDRFRIFHPDGSPMDPAELPGRRAAAGEDAGPVLVRFRSVDDDAADRISQVTAAAIRDGSGAVRYVISTFREVTAEHARSQRDRVSADVARVVGSTLDYEQTLSAIATAVVPEVADWCVLDLLDGGGELVRVATAHGDPAQIALLEELEE